MISEEIWAMVPGFDLDYLVATQIFGKENNKTIWGQKPFEPSKNINDAWLVVENLQHRQMFINVETYRGSFAARVLRVPGPELGYSMEVDAAPEAICKAALLAVMTEEVPA